MSEHLAKDEKHRQRIVAAQELIRSKQVQFISPSVRAVEEVIDDEGRAIVTKFIGSHNAGVDQPAYGMQKAQIKGVCEGEPGTCMHQLKNVQASAKEKLSIELLPCGGLVVKSASKEINKLITEKITLGKNITLTDFIASLELLKVGGLDQISLENITNPELLLKKKDAMSNKVHNSTNLKGNTNEKKTIPMPDELKDTKDPDKSGSCGEGYVMGEDGKCHLTAAAYKKAAEDEKKDDVEDESGADNVSDDTPKKDKDETASEVEKLKEEQASLKKQLNEQIKKPLVASIIKKKSVLGIKVADAVKEQKSLMNRKMQDLESLNADYSEMLKQAGKDIEEHSEEANLPFEMSSHSASSDGQGDGDYGFLDSIREKLG